MNAVVWEPLRRLEEFDRVLDGWLGSTASRSTETAEPVWRPAADYTADAEAYVVRVDLPGVRKDDVDINVENDVRSIHAAHKPVAVEGAPVKGAQTFLGEIRTGTFARSFKLAGDADATAVSAGMSNGVLEVRVPKRKEAQARKIEIKS